MLGTGGISSMQPLRKITEITVFSSAALFVGLSSRCVPPPAPAPSPPEAGADTCQEVLVQTHIDFNSDQTLKLAWMKSIDSDEQLTTTQQAGIGATIPIDGIPFKGFASYSDFASHRDHYLQQENYYLNTSDSRHLLINYLPDAAFPAWAECMAQNNVAILAYPKDISDSALTVYLKYQAPTQINAPPARLTISTRGNAGRGSPPYPNSIRPGQSLRSIYVRLPGQDFYFAVNAGVFSDSFRVPVLATPNYNTQCTDSLDGKQTTNPGTPAFLQCGGLQPGVPIEVQITGTLQCANVPTNVADLQVIIGNGRIAAEFNPVSPSPLGGGVPQQFNFKYNDQSDGDGRVSASLKDVHCNTTALPGPPAQEFTMLFTGQMVANAVTSPR
jgi:hypothetical protein